MMITGTGKRARPAGVVLILLVISGLLNACTPQLPNVPPLAGSGQALTGKVVWHDLVTPDLASARAFYGELFGWRFEQVATGYELVRHNGQLIGGMASLNEADRASYWLPLVSVPDVDRVVADARATGGSSLLPAFDLPGRGRIGVLRDPEGAAFAVVNAVSGDPVDRPAGLNDWLWHEVWVADTNAAERYYSELIGYEVETTEMFGADYSYLRSSGEPRVGVVEKASPEIGSTWVAYIRVDDVEAVTDRVRSLGGDVLMAPTPDIRNGTVAIVRDPDGAGFVIQEWSE